MEECEDGSDGEEDMQTSDGDMVPPGALALPSGALWRGKVTEVKLKTAHIKCGFPIQNPVSPRVESWH